MSKKVLFVATVDTHIRAFHLPYLKWLQDHDFEVHVAANGTLDLPYVDVRHNVPIQRSPVKAENIRAYRQLKNIMDENHYDVIHCHTPVGGVLTRLAARRSRRLGTKVYYTAHGFHFYKGASWKYWLFFYPPEKLLARYTDILFTMNEEDYNLAQQRRFKTQIEYINGVGIHVNKFSTNQPSLTERQSFREELGLSQDSFVLVYVAELSHRKNQSFLFKAMNVLKEQIPQVKLLLVGNGALEQTHKQQVNQLHLNEQVHFLGYRSDADRIFSIADLAVSSSVQEGLPVNIIEALATGLPVIATDVRGHRDLIVHQENGFLVELNDLDAFCAQVMQIYNDESLRASISSVAQASIQKYDIERVLEEVTTHYE